VAELRVGEMLKGAGYPFIPDRSAQHFLEQGTRRFEAGSGLGDRPALRKQVAGAGLVIVAHETTDSLLTYTDWEKFLSFTAHKDLGWAVERHRERGLPETGFRESYRRYAKALVAVGGGTGQDRRLGLVAEVVALKNPYTAPLAAGLPVQVFAFDAPRANAQVEVFARAPSGEVTASLYRTNAQGKVILPMEPGTEYLVDSVVMEERRPGAQERQGAVWHSLWASLTFRTPD